MTQIYDIYGRWEPTVRHHVDLLCSTIETVDATLLKEKMAEDDIEIKNIKDSGDQSNRIDVVFMGDGYRLEERQQFFDDMERLTRDMFEGVTFASYLPLFNIWAIFVPSVDSGIGYDGPKDTPFKLTRINGTLRGIFTENPEYGEAVCLLTGNGGCDFPSLIGNDDFYGGLEGEFTIGTRSNRTGTTVLRHEMGHNFAKEYDNGGTYYGVNSADTVDSVGWQHWLSGTAREERVTYRLLEYPWFDLSDGAITFNFTSDGLYFRWSLLATVSAAGEADCLEFELDGQLLPWTTSGFDDREFYTWQGKAGFTLGQHNLTVRSKTVSTHPLIPRMICSLTFHEFGSEKEFVTSNDHVSAYPTFHYNEQKLYRPTNEGCLMRNMTHNALCNICRENIWREFLTIWKSVIFV